MKSIAPDLRKMAATTSRLVISGAQEAGLGDDKVAVIKERMGRWIRTLEAYSRHIEEVRRSEGTDGELRRRVETLLGKREQERLKLFGG